MSEYKLPRSVLYRLMAEKEHNGPGNCFTVIQDDFLFSQLCHGDRDRALMVCPYEYLGTDSAFIDSVPREIRVLLLCLMASIAEDDER